ncbi:hypothetical protein [Herbidospora cretacea]|uniref:hypothetical protein n=1 Tax=Herbidospora cretacea TaxID=28444 RepID=UPI0004C3C06B|nr:hypothetical protein [Herbidospora cretacea]
MPAFRLPPELAVGLTVVAASPGGPTANLFSHLLGGHAAFNITLTAVNSVLVVVTLPVVVNLSAAHLLPGGGRHRDAGRPGLEHVGVAAPVQVASRDGGFEPQMRSISSRVLTGRATRAGRTASSCACRREPTSRSPPSRHRRSGPEDAQPRCTGHVCGLP